VPRRSSWGDPFGRQALGGTRASVVSFRDGGKYVDGVRYAVTGSRQCWSSNGTTIYTSLMWSDGKASCNCPGWATSKTKDKFGNVKDKTCTHSKQVQAGMAITVDSGRHVATALPEIGPIEAAPKKRKIVL
jgi:hypothetical protein